ncbi:outer membrane protein assembly factor BamA [Crenothrix sp.]|uniref:outer membrane protein assembly factor BamA n=1 Tax=Crenothrix sp. TaxID=3100433 RepID=UPI00374DBB34
MKSNIFARVLLLCLFVSQVVKSEDEFVVRDIKVNGLQRISQGTVFNYLPVNVGERFSLDNVGPAIKALFKTGFFKDVSLERDGSTLVVNVVERPSIAKIIIEGNKDLSKEDLTKALDKIGLSEGKVFDRQILDKVQLELNRQYLSHGKYGLKIKTEVANLTRNRIGIHIKISEGRVTKIKQINIVGNTVYDDKILLRNFELSTSNLLSFYTKNDQYSKQKLSADLETLRSYYLDRGYINFAIESTQVAITPDKKDIYVTINVKEGDVFKVEKVKLAGNLVVKPEELVKLVSIGPEEVFSRKSATETQKALQDRLGDEGYAFANVNMVPEINEAKRTVDMTFFVDPGKRVYVRHINMKGNTKTRDEVLRREMRQMESSWASGSKIERSKTRLERLGYFESVNVETPPVPGTADQIDVNYSVVEKASGNLSAGIGFSQVQGIVINANVSQDNVFGSGKRVNLAFNNSNYATNYQFGFYNPYFTPDGISLGYNIGYSQRNAGQVNIANYSTDVLNAGVDLGIPLNEFDQLRLGFDVKHTTLKLPDDTLTDFSCPGPGIYCKGDEEFQYRLESPNTSDEISDFKKKEGSKFLTFSPSIGWTHDTLNRAIFPTKGGQQRFSALATIPGSDLQYYKVSYKHQLYLPLARDLTLRMQAEIAHGDGYGSTDGLPFFENYFGGGTGSVRGFRNNTLGARGTLTTDCITGQPNLKCDTDPIKASGRPLGGSNKLIANVELFFPVPFFSETKSVRLGTFFDAGRIDNSFGVNHLKYSAGISGEWLSPFGALSVSAAYPLNVDKAAGDQSQIFQFNFGQNF